MQMRTSIDANKSVYDPSSAMAGLQASPPRLYRDSGTQQNFADIYAPAAHKASMDLSRADTVEQGKYYNQAADAQNQSVLAGLGLMGKQQANAQQRNLAMQDMAYGWAKDMLGGFNSALGGLL